MKTIFDPTFRYTANFSTDLKKTFTRIRRTHRAELEKATPAPAANLANDSSIARRSVGR
ncbi:MAG: hypothetical protein WBA53_06110 [Burkholderiaceae bacterium]